MAVHPSRHWNTQLCSQKLFHGVAQDANLEPIFEKAQTWPDSGVPSRGEAEPCTSMGLSQSFP